MEVSDAVLESAPAQADTADSAVHALDVREAVRTLSPEHRAVLVQIYFRGLSVGETAQVLGIPAGTVKSRSYYALRLLSRNLPGYSSRSSTLSSASRDSASTTST